MDKLLGPVDSGREEKGGGMEVGVVGENRFEAQKALCRCCKIERTH